MLATVKESESATTFTLPESSWKSPAPSTAKKRTPVGSGVRKNSETERRSALHCGSPAIQRNRCAPMRVGSNSFGLIGSLKVMVAWFVAVATPVAPRAGRTDTT